MSQCSTEFLSGLFLCSTRCSDVKVQVIGARSLNRQLVRSNAPSSHTPSGFYPSPGHTCQRRPASIETLLSSLSWLCPPLCLFTVQSGAWHWSLLTARPASVKCMRGEKKKAHSESQEAQHTTSAFVFCVRQVVWTQKRGSGPEDAAIQSWRILTVYITSGLILIPNMNENMLNPL